MSKQVKIKMMFSFAGIVIFILTCYILKLKGFTLTTNTTKDNAIVLNTIENISLENKDIIKTDKEQKEKIEKLETDKTIEDDNVKEITIKEKETEDKTKLLDEADKNEPVETKTMVEEKNSPNFIKSLYYETDDYVVTVDSVENAAIPNGSILQVTEIIQSDSKYKEIEDELISKVEEEENSLAGFIAYDIKLKDKDGKEIEPNGKVNVVFDYKKAIKPDVDLSNTAIGIHHFEEDENGEVIQIVDLEENNQLQNIEVNDESKIERIEFETDSFSTFTITYRYNNGWNSYTTYVTIGVHYVDESGNEIDANQEDIVMTFDRSTNNVNNIILEDYANKLTGIDKTKYTYIDAHYNSYNGKIITEIEGKTLKDSASINPKTVNCTIKFLNDTEIVGMIEYENSARSVDIYLMYTDNSDISILDTIANDGCINALTGGEIIPSSNNIIYKWYRSTDNITYNLVNRLKITGDSYNIPEENGPSINVALDEGANRYYKVEKYLVGSDGTETLLGEYTYHVPYFSDVQNGSFETPKVIGDSNAQIENGSNGVVWKTTGTHNGQDIEIVNANSSGQNTNDANMINKTINDYNFAYVPDGNQCAELNAEEYGALYQDILTVPGTQLYWSLYHRARGYYSGATTTINRQTYAVGGDKTENNATDTMYVIAIAAEDAEKYDITTQDKVLEIIEKIKAKEPGFEDVEVVTITTTNNGNGIMQFLQGDPIIVGGKQYGSVGRNGTVGGGSYTVGGSKTYTFSSSTWHYYSGHFSIPSNQYLTRFFFISGTTTTGGNNTMGNLLDDIKVSSVMPAPNNGQATIRLTKNVTGLPELPSNYSVPLSVSYNLYENKNNTSTGVTETTKTRNFNSFSLVYDENDILTGERKQWHDYTLTIPANGKGKIVSFKELSEEDVNALNENDGNYLYGYQVGGYKLETSYIVKKKAKNSEQEIIIDRGVITNYQSDIEINEDLVNGDLIEIEFTNRYIEQYTNISINKIDVDNNLLPGSIFNLKYLNLVDNTLADYETHNTYTSDGNSDGKLEFSNIKYSIEENKNIYTLTEIESPQGYYKFNKEIKFYVTYDSENKKDIIHLENGEEISEYVTLNSDNSEINVINVSRVEMPKAGGQGTKIYQIFGLLVIAFNVLIINLINNRRKRK